MGKVMDVIFGAIGNQGGAANRKVFAVVGFRGERA